MNPGRDYTYDLAAPQSNELDALGVFMIHHAVPLRGTTCGDSAPLPRRERLGVHAVVGLSEVTCGRHGSDT